MNMNIAYITLIILLITMFYQIKIWKIRVLMSPGFYFSAIWILGVLGLLLYKSVDMLIEINPEYIDELNILISFTALCFILVTKIGIKKINPLTININYFVSFRIFKLMSVFFLLLAIYVFFVEGRGFDFGAARDNMHTTIASRSFLVGYFRLLSIPLSIYAGSKIIKSFFKIEKASVSKYIFLMLPFISDMLFSLAEGGRSAMVYSMLLYIVGAVLTIPKSFRAKERKKFIFYAVIIAVFMNIMITWIATVRSDADNISWQTELIKEKLGILAPLYGAMEYVTVTYTGYQYRRVDAVDATKLGYGQYTFNGFINWQIPFASRLGIKDASIAKAFNIYYHNQETYDFSREYYYTTHSAYIPIIKDFGFTGAFFAIFFIVYCSHYLFVKIQRKRNIKYSISFYFYYLFFIYWAKSNFYGTLSSSVLIPLYGFLIVDLVNSIGRRKKRIVSK